KSAVTRNYSEKKNERLWFKKNYDHAGNQRRIQKWNTQLK
uniref:COP9 signalosome complex subunit 2 (Fragments) n=1 Tax=Brassica oleracea TaxID=3712 RepID=CSN2_BRAOL|nr:RecName: Full=COP9 signalosome complex subunit 2; Short=Signalosome subunit 2; AltName: Full=FUSCA protein 12; Short=FUSCA12 [Brassica oleracea]